MSAVWKGMKQVTGYDCMKKKVNVVNESEFVDNSVVKQFKSVKERKAPGPDNIGGKIMKTCAEQLAAIFT